MNIRNSFVVLAALIPSSAQAGMVDQLCPRLRTFEAAKLSGADRRWVEFHWGNDKTSIWSWGCRHSKDQLAKATCDWLMQHTNQEFSMMLPHRIMACHGYTFPKRAYFDWDGVEGTIRLRGAANRHVLMELAYSHLPERETAVRLAVEEDGHSYEPDKLPSIQPLSPNASEKP